MKRVVILFMFVAIFTMFTLSGCDNQEKPDGDSSMPTTLGTTKKASASARNNFDGETDFPYKMTTDEADALFGKPLEVLDEESAWGAAGIRKYQIAECTFLKDKPIGLASMLIVSPGYAPVREIQVGDTLESVIAKFPEDKIDTETWPQDLKPLYGKYNEANISLETCGYVQYDNDQPTQLCFFDSTLPQRWKMVLDLDNNLCVSRIWVSMTT